MKKKNYRSKHAEYPAEVVPAAKRRKLTPWQVHMKDFGSSDGISNELVSINIAGKEVMTTSGVKEFIKAAYHAMHGPVKDMPMERCSDETETLSLTAKDVKREGKKKIASIVCIIARIMCSFQLKYASGISSEIAL